MTREQIQRFEYCKEHKLKIKEWVEKLPFGNQVHGCGTGSPPIELKLEQIHRKMNTAVANAMSDALNEVEELIKNI